MSESINSQHALDPGAFQPPVPEYLYRRDPPGKLLDADYGAKDVMEIRGAS